MNRILQAVKLDFYTAKSTLRLSAVTFLASIAIGAVTKQPVFTAMFVMVFAVFLGGNVFSTHEKNHSEKLYGILPLKKSEMIAGRYLYGLAIGAANMVIAGVLAWAVAGVRNINTNSLLLWSALALAFIYYCFAMGVSYPIYFKFTFAKAYVFTMLPMYLIVLFLMLLNRRTDFASGLSSLSTFFTAHQYLIPVCGILAGLILLTVSAVIANLIYTRKEI